jgi:hypothetical protein
MSGPADHAHDCACAENPPEPSSARKTLAKQRKKPVKTLGLEKADCEDFFFIRFSVFVFVSPAQRMGPLVRFHSLFGLIVDWI